MKKPKTYHRTHKGLKPISRLGQDIGRKSFKKQGFNGIEIFKQWPHIVGENLSQYCRPEKINWPRQSNALNGATLVIKCLGAFALEIESNAPMILQRANIMFGYEAIGKIKLKQTQVIDFKEKNIIETEIEAPKTVVKSTSPVKNPKLRDALNALGAQVYAQAKES